MDSGLVGVLIGAVTAVLGLAPVRMQGASADMPRERLLHPRHGALSPRSEVASGVMKEEFPTMGGFTRGDKSGTVANPAFHAAPCWVSFAAESTSPAPPLRFKSPSAL